jgi:hypothetical protein
VQRVWTANPDFKLKDLTNVQFEQEVADFKAALSSLDDQAKALIPLRNDRDAKFERMNNLLVRLRAGIKGYFGDNSDEYELAGGTRTIDRSSPQASAKVAPAEAPVPASTK